MDESRTRTNHATNAGITKISTVIEETENILERVPPLIAETTAPVPVTVFEIAEPIDMVNTIKLQIVAGIAIIATGDRHKSKKITPAIPTTIAVKNKIPPSTRLSIPAENPSLFFINSLRCGFRRFA